jgi:putative oxidoreductase
VNDTLSGSVRDVALLISRLLLGTIMFAHGYQKLMVDGLGRTTDGFETMSIPVAIFSAAFVTVVEVVGGVLVILGGLLTAVAACYLVVMTGAAVFVHISNGIFVGNGGWELVGAIAALLLALAAAGSGRYGLDDAVRRRQARTAVPSVPAAAIPGPASPVLGPVSGRPDLSARASAFTEVFPRVGAAEPAADEPTPPLPTPRAVVDPSPAPLPVRRRRAHPSPTTTRTPEP